MRTPLGLCEYKLKEKILITAKNLNDAITRDASEDIIANETRLETYAEMLDEWRIQTEIFKTYDTHSVSNINFINQRNGKEDSYAFQRMVFFFFRDEIV